MITPDLSVLYHRLVCKDAAVSKGAGPPRRTPGSFQLDTSLAALDFELPAALRAALDQASAVPPESVYRMFTPACQGWIVSPGTQVGDKPAGYQPPVRNWAGSDQ